MTGARSDTIRTLGKVAWMKLEERASLNSSAVTTQNAESVAQFSLISLLQWNDSDKLLSSSSSSSLLSLLQCIYNYIPETNHVSRVYNVAAVRYLQFVLNVMLFRPVKYVLYFYISTFRCMCAVTNMAVFCSSLISCFPGMVFRYCLSDFQKVPVAPIITCIIFAFTFHMRWISIMRPLYFKIFSASFLMIFLSPGIATSINLHVTCLLSRIMMSGVLLGTVP